MVFNRRMYMREYMRKWRELRKEVPDDPIRDKQFRKLPEWSQLNLIDELSLRLLDER